MDGSSPTYPSYLCVERPGRDWRGLYHGRNPALWSTTATANTSKPLRPHSPAQVRVGACGAVIVGSLRVENVTRMSSCEVYVGVPVVSLLKMKRHVPPFSNTYCCRQLIVASDACAPRCAGSSMRFVLHKTLSASNISDASMCIAGQGGLSDALFSVAHCHKWDRPPQPFVVAGGHFRCASMRPQEKRTINVPPSCCVVSHRSRHSNVCCLQVPRGHAFTSKQEQPDCR
jgi:hypothetical protein